jgi:putative transposase
LKDYDYSERGPYFVTICVKNRECLFGEIMASRMRLNESGELIQRIWDELPNRYTNLDLDACILMPNHIHGIIVLTDNAAVGAPLAAPFPGRASPAPTLGGIVRTFKSISTILLNRLLSRTGRPLWQRNYYEHIIRNEKS